MSAPHRLQTAFGTVVRKRRLALGVSQEALAGRCGLHRTYISEIERGLKSASLRAITLIADALDVKPHVLLEDAEDEAAQRATGPKRRSGKAER